MHVHIDVYVMNGENGKWAKNTGVKKLIFS